MPRASRPRQPPTDEWNQLRLLVRSAEQETYELLRPIVLFGQPASTRARETGVPERTLRRKAARFAAQGMRSLFPELAPPAPDRRRLPPAIRRAIVELKAECPALRPYELATICHHRFDRPVSHHTVERVLASEPLPLRPPRRFPHYRDIPDPVARRTAIVTLYLECLTKPVTDMADLGHGQTPRERRTVGLRRPAAPARVAQAQRRPTARAGPRLLDRHHLRPEVRHPVGDAAPGDGVRLGHDLLAPLARLAASRRLGRAPSGAARSAGRSRPD
jgi:hypothetical protein